MKKSKQNKPVEKSIEKLNSSIEKIVTEIPEPTISIINKPGYFSRHFTLCRYHKSQQDAYEQCEVEYQQLAKELRLDKKIMFSSYDSFRNAKSIYYSNSNNR